MVFAVAERLLHLSQILIAVMHCLLGSGALGKVCLDNITAVQPSGLFQRRLVHA